ECGGGAARGARDRQGRADRFRDDIAVDGATGLRPVTDLAADVDLQSGEAVAWQDRVQVASLREECLRDVAGRLARRGEARRLLRSDVDGDVDVAALEGQRGAGGDAELEDEGRRLAARHGEGDRLPGDERDVDHLQGAAVDGAVERPLGRVVGIGVVDLRLVVAGRDGDGDDVRVGVERYVIEALDGAVRRQGDPG